jgi:hypothetical protein
MAVRLAFRTVDFFALLALLSARYDAHHLSSSRYEHRDTALRIGFLAIPTGCISRSCRPSFMSTSAPCADRNIHLGFERERRIVGGNDAKHVCAL